MFSKLDLKWGYHQIELDPASREITTFVTHKGLRRYKRLMFGISSAPEVYQHVIQQALEGCNGVRNISDDIIVFGKDAAEHNANLEQVFKRLGEKGLTVNREKCLFGVAALTFFGVVVSGNGVSPEDKKIEAIRTVRKPSNAAEVRSFLGLVNYCARFIPNFATMADPLRQLTKKGTPWVWTNAHQTAFQQLKAALTSESVMAHYDPTAPTHLRVDASPVGLGAILTQTQRGVVRPVAYASRTLTDVERRYSQTEKEALAIVWGCERFHLYLYATEFELFTDHKPLEAIYHPRSKPPARVERWTLRLQPYRFKVTYTPGKDNPADVLSRLPIENQPFKERSIAEEYINGVSRHSVPKATSLEEIQAASKQDKELQDVRNAIEQGTWTRAHSNLTPYFQIRTELSVINDIVLRGTRIVVPKVLRERTLKIAHEGHQGIVKTKQLLRTKVWWPGIDREVETLVSQCIPCQAQAPKTTPEPLRMTTMPSEPWKSIHIDFCGPFPTGETLLVLVDACSRWPEVEILKSTTAETLIRRLEKIFACYGFPEEITSDNGPQFISETFKEYLLENNIRHRKVIPYWPQANAEVERSNRTLEKAL